MRLMTKKVMKQYLKEVDKRKKFREALLQLVKNRSMNKPEIKTVYVPVNNETKSTNVFGIVKPIDKSFVKFVEEQQLITFTPKEYNKHIQEVIDDALNTAAKEVTLKEYDEIDWDINWMISDSKGQDFILNKESIINTSKQTFEKWKI